MRHISKIIVHCSASAFGDADLIDRWHKERGWRGIGYHWVIGNGHPDSSAHFDVEFDGKIEKGRDESLIGAHCYRHNSDSIGVCLISAGEITEMQYDALDMLLNEAQNRHDIPMEMIFGHADFDKGKPYCPGFDVREWLKKRRTF